MERISSKINFEYLCFMKRYKKRCIVKADCTKMASKRFLVPLAVKLKV